jgi:hypothetical protein
MPEADQERWLTYADLGAALGCSANAARMHAKRRGWARITPNAHGDRARVLVPDDAFVQPRAAFVPDRDQEQPHTDDQMNKRLLAEAIASLREQLTVANERARRAEDRVDELLTVLTEERRRMIEILTGSARPAWWRRWFR